MSNRMTLRTYPTKTSTNAKDEKEECEREPILRSERGTIVRFIFQSEYDKYQERTSNELAHKLAAFRHEAGGIGAEDLSGSAISWWH